jgi:hypothetical protein
MKIITLLITGFLITGCQVLGGWVGAHQAGIVAVATVAGAVNQVESAAINGIALAKEVKEK